MKEFNKVIGYESIKNELMQVCDMLKNPERYIMLGAKIPSGILIYGEPGLGKSLMADCFAKESGMDTIRLRKTKSDDFASIITKTFEKAKEKAPCIVMLDDMDKFANEDARHKDADEYVAIQSGIDEVKGSAVFVLATANDIDKLPDSLTRAGRFDVKIEVCSPGEEDSLQIIKHYLSGKKLADDVDINDLHKMIEYSSCADLEAVLNEAAIKAAYNGKESIGMQDLVSAVLRMEYNAPDECTQVSQTRLNRVAIHEAAHLTVCEVLAPGSVGLVSLRKRGRDSLGGFVRRCKKLPEEEYDILVSLAGKVAEELYYCKADEGCENDIRRAKRRIRDMISDSAARGYGMVNVSNYDFNPSEAFNSKNEAVVQAELERYTIKAREIILKNSAFLELATDQLISKETLLYSDIKRIRQSVAIVSVPE